MDTPTEFATDQEQFWAGEFGNTYIDRNQESEALIASRIPMFATIVSRLASCNSILEFGANIGINLKILHLLCPQMELAAVEINSKAVATLNQLDNGSIRVYNQSALQFAPDFPRDLVLSSGFLMHINPEHLHQMYEIMWQTAKRYICIVEYYNPVPVEVLYRGHGNKLFKRDFAGEMLDKFPSLQLLDYGFIYHRDRQFPQDDVTWFLLEKMP